MSDGDSTSDIVLVASRHIGPDAFFGRFAGAWSQVSETVRKIETRQEYREPGNPSWERLLDSGLEEAKRILPAAREVDLPLYGSLRQRSVRFTRCRPIKFPLTLYMQWEIACYDYNSAQGEEIFFANVEDVAGLLEGRIHHDFMVFDHFVAFIHDYDGAGQIRGGWETREASHIAALVGMFEEFKARCVPYRQSLDSKH